MPASAGGFTPSRGVPQDTNRLRDSPSSRKTENIKAAMSFRGEVDRLHGDTFNKEVLTPITLIYTLPRLCRRRATLPSAHTSPFAQVRTLANSLLEAVFDDSRAPTTAPPSNTIGIGIGSGGGRAPTATSSSSAFAHGDDSKQYSTTGITGGVGGNQPISEPGSGQYTGFGSVPLQPEKPKLVDRAKGALKEVKEIAVDKCV